MKEVNYLIIGSGIGGLTLAIKLAEAFPRRTIAIVSKATETESNTRHAQGGIAVVVDKIKDSYEKHIADTIVSGDGLCDRKVVEMVVSEGPKRLKELMEWGAVFDKDNSGRLALGKEGGHTANRIVHRKDRTGFEIEQAILNKVHKFSNVTILEHHFAVDLMVHENKCSGTFILDCTTNQLCKATADYTIFATGGIGQLYAHSTNSKIATGDGIAMAFRAKAKICDMEFIQFHPTAFYSAEPGARFLISEAIRGAGAYIRNKSGIRFILDDDERGELATRDIVSRSIAFELQSSGEDCVYIDCTHLKKEDVINDFPTIYHYCMNHGIDITKEWIPVIPAQHYLCGGILVDRNGKTTIENLFAVGECSRTGLHGANRLASNSLLEALVFSHRIFKYLSVQPFTNCQSLADGLQSYKELSKNPIVFNELTKQLQELMSCYAGIIRDNESLSIAHTDVNTIYNTVRLLIDSPDGATKELYELYNMSTVALLVIEASQARRENCGGFIKYTNHSLQ